MKKKEPHFVPLHIHGIFDEKKNEIVRISLDQDEIDLELALEDENSPLVECEFDVTLVL